MKKIRTILIFLVLSVLLVSCNDPKRTTTVSYFDGTVIVERVSVVSFDNDEINITFLKEGTYDIAYLPVNPGDKFWAPESTTIVIENIPSTEHFQRFSISDVRVSITVNGITESHNLILE